MASQRSMIERALAVIECCVGSDEPTTLGALQRETGLPKATAWRICQELTQQGLLEKFSAGYRPGPRLVDLGGRASVRQLRAPVVPDLTELQRSTGAAVWMIDVRSQRSWPIVYSTHDRTQATRYSDNWPHDPTSPGILTSALGLLALAFRPEHVNALLGQPIPRLTPHTEVRPDRIATALRRALDDHACVEHESFYAGWSCLTVPIFNRGYAHPVAIVGVMQRTPRFAEQRLLRVTRRAADALADRLPTPG